MPDLLQRSTLFHCQLLQAGLEQRLGEHVLSRRTLSLCPAGGLRAACIIPLAV